MSRIAINGMLLSPPYSGVEVTILELARALAKHSRFEYVLFVPEEAELGFDSTDTFQVERIKLSVARRTSRILWEHEKLPRRAEELGCRLLHCPGYIAPFRCKLPIVVTVHDCFVFSNPEWCKLSNRMYYRLMFERSLCNAARILVATDHVRAQILEFFSINAGKIRKVPFGVSERFGPVEDPIDLEQLRIKYSLPEEYALYVGNFEPKKNLPFLLEAFFRASSHLSDSFQLVLTGGKAWGKDVQSQISGLGLSSKVVITGYIAEEDLPTVYAGAEMLLFPSLGEGFGLPVLEAMASGTPVICSDRGGLPEVADKAAVVVDAEDVDGLAIAIRDLDNDIEKRHELIAKGLKHSHEYSWQRTAAETEVVFAELLEM